MLKTSGLTACVGRPTGCAVKFNNGLTACPSGDTGITAEQKTVVVDHYKVQRVVMTIGDMFTAGPRKAAYFVNELIKPAFVTASHVDKLATNNGTVKPGTRTASFMKSANMPAHVPHGGRTMAFDAGGKCAGGC